MHAMKLPGVDGSAGTNDGCRNKMIVENKRAQANLKRVKQSPVNIQISYLKLNDRLGPV